MKEKSFPIKEFCYPRRKFSYLTLWSLGCYMIMIIIPYIIVIII